MEEAAVKAAPVARLRRRLSVEVQDESNSPTPSTPTKKRGRLAAKPQLDLIEENGVIESPSQRTTRKSISRDAEVDKTLTPSRRSTRIRSNTSLVDKEDDEKLTPSRRTTRVRSNTVDKDVGDENLTPGRRTTRLRSETSLLAEITAPPVDSPRAKRATRRASLLGSDNEGTLTPTKSRRTRKDSTSSIDVQATPATADDVVTPAKIRRGRANRNLEDDANVVKSVIDKIPEEETSDRKSLAKDSEESSNAQLSQSSNNSSSQPSRTFTPSPNTARKSPRLMLKKSTPENNAKEMNSASQNKSNPAVDGLDKTVSNDQPDGMIMYQTKSETNNVNDLSVSSTNLISNLEKKPQNKKPGINKSTSAMDSKDQSKRFRTRSCTTLVDPPSEDLFFSDNEKTKKKKQRKLASESQVHGSNNNLAIDVPSEKHSSQKKKKKQNESIFTDSTTEITLNKSSEDLGLKPADTSTDSNKENELSKTTNTSNAVKYLFETNPATSIQSLEIIEDSDSGDIIKVTDEIKPAEDQCVPVVFSETVNSSVPNLFAIQTCGNEKPDDRSIEPMDIDETMPSNVSLTEFNRSRNSSLCMLQNVNEKSNRKSSISIIASLNVDIDANTGDKKSNRKSSISKDFDKSTTENTSLKANSNKSPRKSSISNISQNVEHSDLQNKSTLVLSELNVSTVSETNASKTVKGDKSPRKSSISKDFDGSVAENTESPRKSSGFVAENTKSPRKSSISKDFDKSAADNTSLKVNTKSVTEKTKSPRKSSISKDFDKSVAENTSLIAISKKSPRKSSISKDLDQSTQDTSKNVSLNDNSVAKLIINGVPHKDPKKNTLMPCLTSTPVQDSAKKTQINSSTAMTPVVENKIVKAKKVLSKSKSSAVSESSDSDDDSEDSSKDRNDLVDDEAMDAGDDYQSGDSQDEEERLYERVNEIMERGEILTSDDDVSNDSDYEKDSFLVSSDQEDEELLSGSGDDLDMSDNELTMSKKSKKRFNDRKTKEQKNASREMYEARHQLSNEGVKKNVRSRIDSTLLDSGDDNKVPPKKNKRMRIESETSGIKSDLEKSVTPNTSTAEPEIGHKKKKRLSESCNESDLNENETTIVDNPEIAYREIGQKKKKSKRLLESCNESDLNENEMTIVADPETNLENDDPLVIKIKPEPKTPQKDFDVSTVHFTDREEIEQVEVQENVTMMKSNETSDPLQASFEENDDESISENEEATKNYESILENLNNEHKLPIKSRDVSLNLPKDKSQKAKVPLIEELNITTTKEKATKKEKAGKSSQIAESGTNKSSQNAESGTKTNKIINIDESSSSSIDLKLLFSEESNDGDKGGNNNIKDIYTKTPDKNIPLKRCYGKTNLRENIDEDEADTNSENLPFFIDTVGTYGNVNDETLDNSSTKNIKHKKNRTTSNSSVSDKHTKTTSFVELEDAIDSSMFNVSSKKNKSKASEGASDDNKANISQSSKIQKSFIEDTVDSSLNSSKIIHKKADSSCVKDDAINSSINLNSTKKNKNSDEGKSDNSFSVKTKKNKKVDIIQDDDSDAPVEISSKNNESTVDEYKVETPVETFFSKKKSKKNKKVENSEAQVETNSRKNDSLIIEHMTETVEATSKNKSKKVETSTVDDEVTNKSLDTSSKNKSKKSKSKELTDEVNTEINVVNEDQSNDSSIKANKKSKKGSRESKTTKISESQEVVLLDNNKISESESSKNKKRKHVVEEQECFPANHTKKPKIADSIDTVDQQVVEKSEKHSKKKNKHTERLELEQTLELQTVDAQSKKRKKRDDDIGGIKSKVMKQDSFDEIHVARLPDAILNQLDDKPTQQVLESKKSQLVSTTDFNVETTKRRTNKPSNFLEESVFLNHYKSPVAKKQKPKTSLPKILPFIPVASTSDKGFTTNFQVKVLDGKMEFVAKAEKKSNFKTDYLLERRNKKLRTYDLYKKHRNVKLSKF